MARVSLTVNGVQYTEEVEPRLLLVHLIRDTLGLTGNEMVQIVNVEGALAKPGSDVAVKIGDRTITVTSRIDTPQEAEYYRHGGILQYVLRQLAGLL